MSVSDNLGRRVPAGEIVKPWLMLGPFYEDLSDRVQGLTLFERPGATVGNAAMVEIVDEAKVILASRPREGEEATFRGEPGAGAWCAGQRSTCRGGATTSPTTWVRLS